MYMCMVNIHFDTPADWNDERDPEAADDDNVQVYIQD
jgi:hypothetical protein